MVLTTETAVVAGVGRLLLCLAAATLAACSPGGNRPTPPSFRLLLLHTNDMHSFFEEFNGRGMPCDSGESCYGGFARLKWAIEMELKKVSRADPNAGALVLNAGDTFQGTMYYSVFRWKIVADLLPKLGFDVICLGNHEFDDGVDNIDLFLKNINVPVVASNLDLSEEQSLKSRKIMTKSKVMEVKGRRIGIIGYLTPDTKKLSSVGKVEFFDEIKSIKEEAVILKNSGVKIIIALGHSGFEMDRKIAQEVEEVDIVVGGHSHTFLYSGKPPGLDKPEGSYPFRVLQEKTNKIVPVVQAFQHTKYLGELWVDFDDDGNVVSSSGNPILLDSSIDQDPKMLESVHSYRSKFIEKKKEIIGQTKVPLECGLDVCRLKECNCGNFITDAYVYYNAKKNTEDYDSNKFWTDSPIALQNSGALRKRIVSSYDEKGNMNISYYQLSETLSFMNIMGKVYLTGKEIKKTLEHAVFRYNEWVYPGAFLQVSGLKITIDFSKPSGERVSSILVKSTLRNHQGQYEQLKDQEKYRVILSEYIWLGGDGFEFNNKDQNFVSIGLTDFDIISQHIHKNSPISPEVEGRITLENIDHLQGDSKGQASSDQRKTEFSDPLCGNQPKN